MTIEHQSCDKCGNDMGYHQVKAIKPKSVTRLCKACSTFSMSSVTPKTFLGDPLATFFDKRDRDEILHSQRSLQSLEINKCEV
jgi:hypothetical protein